MAGTLDQLIRPGERVVYRTGTKRTAVRVFLILASALAFVVVILWALFVAVFAVSFETVSWVFSTLLIAIVASALGIWLQSGAAIVTTRRMLLDRGPGATLWTLQRRFDLPLSEIAEISGIEPGWHQAPRLHLTDGRVLEIGTIADPEQLAEALARVRGATPATAPDATGGQGDDQ
jgi:hypothetical protein